MEVFSRIREKNAVVNKLVEVQKSVWYPAFFAVLGALASAFGMAAYIPIFWILTLTVVFAALFSDDVKVFLVPLFLAYYSIGSDTEYIDISISRDDVLGAFAPAGLVNMIICGAIMVTAMIYKFAVTGVLHDAVTKRGLYTIGLLCLSGAFMLNGVFSSSWTAANLAIGALEAVGIFFIYFLVLSMTDKTTDSVAYACKIMVCLGGMILIEMFILSMRLGIEDKLFWRDADGSITGFRRENTIFAWGEFNITGALLAVCIPAAMYLAHSRRYPVLPYVSAIAFYAAVVFSNARTAILIGGIAFVVCIVICCFTGKNRVVNRIVTGAFIATLMCTLLGMISCSGGIDEFAESVKFIFRFDAADSGRFELWQDGMSDFTRAPVFGVGFLDGGYNGNEINGNFYSNFYHNIGVEFLGALGIVGVLAFLIHFKNWLEVLIRKFSFGKCLICGIPALIIALSLLDNFFWYTNFQIIFGAFLAFSERKLEDARAEDIQKVKPVVRTRPRVVFTLVEAGKGHITPVQAVAEAFEKKYGDRAETIVSRFYTESGDRDLEDFEKGFSLAVKLQSRNGILGKLCLFGNFIAGDALGQQYLMAMTPGGMKSKPKAVEHLRDLDADLLYTAHWATAFYSKHLDVHPYTMMFCPDAYSNGMFNMDCNELLMPTVPGYEQVVGRRMYAGGNITGVPFPIRPEADKYLGKKAECREKLGIKDSFVVTLCDGGYGMARLEETVKALASSDKNLTLIALCGTNDALFGRLKNMKTSPTVHIIPVGYTEDVLGYIAAADVFMGKGGANSMAEPAYFGIPVIITKCITYIEKFMKRYYVDIVRGGMYIPNVKKAVERVFEFVDNPSLLEPYARKMETLKTGYGAEAIADLIWQRLTELKKKESV